MSKYSVIKSILRHSHSAFIFAFSLCHWVSPIFAQGSGSSKEPVRAQPPKRYLVSPVYINGKGNDSLVALAAISLDSENDVRALANSRQVGALWGVSYNRTDKQVYASAFAKRHVAYGMLGTGGIYRTDWHSKKTIPWLDLTKFGVSTGSDHHRDLKTDPDSNSVDPQMMEDVGKLSLGGMDISASGEYLYVMSLNDRKLYEIKIPSDTARRPAQSDIKAFVVPDPGCKGGNYRPFAVKVFGGKIYVGVVCDAELSQSARDLTATVFELDPGTKRFVNVFDMKMDYRRGKPVAGLDTPGWLPWTNNFVKALNSDFPSTATRPQPILSSIDFDETGAMILGFMDRFGHQSGVGQPDPEGKASYSGVAAGDVLRVYRRDAQGKKSQYLLEANATTGAFQSDGRENGQGPSGGEFYFQDGFTFKDEKRKSRIVHEEVAGGAVLALPDTKEILITAHEPTGSFNSGGVKSFFNADGHTSRGWSFYGDGQTGTFGKANGVGGLALVSDESGITVGNLVWHDQNGNGTRDPEDETIAGVNIELWDGGTKLGEIASDAAGSYLFGDNNVTGGLKPGTNYELKINLMNQGLIPTINTAAPSAEKSITNVGVGHGTYSVATFTTGKTGEGIRGIDFGFRYNNELRDTDSDPGRIIRIYPNPVKDKVNILSNAASEKAELVITDLSGSQIIKKLIKNSNGFYTYSFLTSGFPAGQYIITIEENTGLKTSAKFIKE